MIAAVLSAVLSAVVPAAAVAPSTGGAAADVPPTTAASASASKVNTAAKVGAASPTTVSADTKFCRVAASNAQTLLSGTATALAGAAAGGKSGAAKLRTFMDKVKIANTALAAVAPPAMRAPLTASLQQTDALVLALEKVGYDLTKLDPSALPKQSPGTNTITSYLVTVCRIDASKALTH